MIRRGDVVRIRPVPSAVGHEQAGHRPWLVVTDERLHEARGVFWAVPLTRIDRGWALHVEVPETQSVAMVEQMRAFSVERVRNDIPIERVSAPEVFDQVRRVALRLLGG